MTNNGNNVIVVTMLPLFVTLKKVYDRNVVNKYGLYLLLGVIIYNLIDYISICTDAELFISFCRILCIYHIYIYMEGPISTGVAKNLTMLIQITACKYQKHYYIYIYIYKHLSEDHRRHRCM